MNELTPEEKLHGKWFLMYTTPPSNTQWRYIHAPSGYFYADPMIIYKNQLHYVFFELFDYKKGKIAYLIIDDNLNHSEPKLIDIPITSHVSYPSLFEDEGTLYMTPETCHQNKINIYECVSFPDKWAFKKTLINDVHSSDPNILKHNGKYWLFTTIYKDNRNTFCIFYADSLFSEWHPHKIVNANNCIDNEDITRNAGQFWTTFIKPTIRQAQYSMRGINGEAIITYQINKLTETEYNEIPIQIFSKENLGNVRATHTCSREDRLIIFDARGERDSDQPYQPINEKAEPKKIMDRNFYVNHDILKEAFSLNTSGNGRCYYGATIQGVHYEGERNWDSRWDLIKNCTDFSNKRVLDIGCNNGILLTYLKKFREIQSGLGIEQPDDLLAKTNKADTIKSFNLLNWGFFTNNVRTLQIDLNKTDYESTIGTDFDIVAAMSILKWIEDKERFIKFLSKISHIIYEGHESDEEEIQRFKEHGFEYQILGKTQTGKSYDISNTRTLILFTK